MYKNIMFDLDGTVTDSGRAITSSVEYALADFGITDQPREKLNTFIGPSLYDSFEREYGFKGEDCDKAVALYRYIYEKERMYDVDIYEGIPELLEKLQNGGFKVFLITSKPLKFSVQILEKIGLSKYFDHMIGPDLTDHSSDKKRLIEKAISEQGLEKSECIMIGDTQYDIDGAVAAGVDSIAVTYGYGNVEAMKAAGATFFADSARDIGKILGVVSDMVDEIRRAFKTNDDIRDEGLTTPDDIERFDDIVYGENEKWQVLDVYRPRNAKGKLPVIISVHGGAWVYGDKERYQYYCMSLAQRGFAVVNFTYRLAPEFKYPAPLVDTDLVARFVVENSEKYGFDLGNVFAVGDSAGAHILGLYACMLTNTSYAQKFDIKLPDGFSFKAIALNCGVYRIDKKDGREQDLDLMKLFLLGGATEDELKDISVAEHITKEFPPVFVMTADGDFLKDQPGNIIGKLLDENVPFTFRYYSVPEMQLGHVFHLNLRLSEATRCNDEECAFFKGFVD